MLEALGLWTEGGGPLYRRLALALMDAMRTGAIPAGARLPAERALAAWLQISRSTVVAAYALLAEAEWVEIRHGSGAWVREPPPHHAADYGAAQAARVGALGRGPVFDAFLRRPAMHAPPIDLATGAVAWPAGLRAESYLPDARALAPLLDGYGYLPLGLLALRQALAAHATRAGLPTTAEQILVTTGAQQAITLVAACLVQRGDAVLIESPTYFGALDAFRAAGARLLPVPVGPDGLDAERLERRLAMETARCLYILPTLHNPTGTSISGAWRRRLVQSAEGHGVTIIEDLAMADLTLEGDTPPPLATYAEGDGVISIGSLSKSVWGGVRVGWIRAAPPLIGRLARLKAITDLGSSVLGQLLALNLLPDLARIQGLRREELRARLERLGAEMERRLPSWSWRRPAGGLFLWAKLPRGDARALAQAALQAGVLVTPGPTLAVEETHTDYLRVSFVAAPDAISAGVARLAEAWERYTPAADRGIYAVPVLL